MKINKVKWKRILIVVLIFLIWEFGVLTGDFMRSMEEAFSLWHTKGDYELPQLVYLKKTSPDGQCTAYILKHSKSGAYYFAIQKKGGPMMVVDDDVSPTSGYHSPVFDLAWKDNGNQVEISVDSHFGDFIRKFHFDINALTFLEPVFWGAQEK